MMHIIVNPDRYCECGALAGNGSQLCLKCQNCYRWLRRKAWKQHKTR
jgi:hypothetical protein